MPVATVRLRGVLTEHDLNTALGAVDPKTTGLLVDACDMTDYEPAARSLFVEWSRGRRGTLKRIAIVVRVPLWRMVVSAMGIAARLDMRAFETVEQAEAWLAPVRR